MVAEEIQQLQTLLLVNRPEQFLRNIPKGRDTVFFDALQNLIDRIGK